MSFGNRSLEDDLFLRLIQRIEGVKNLWVRSLLGQKLNIVDHQHVDIAIALPEASTILSYRIELMTRSGELFRSLNRRIADRCAQPDVSDGIQ